MNDNRLTRIIEVDETTASQEIEGGVHIPVLVREVIRYLTPRDTGVYVDGTAGLGGHATHILEESAPSGRLIGIDLDVDALAISKTILCGFGERCTLIQGNYANLNEQLKTLSVGKLDGVLLDLGVSSLQVDTPSRGFSFSQSGKLDMRMDRNQPLSAAEVINDYCEHALTDIFLKFGEERWSKKIAYRICRARQIKRITTTLQLAEIVEEALPKSSYRGRIHPATRIFQALRIHVNNELTNLETGLDAAVSCLKPGGRICVISFHSLEDRIVKHRFRALSRACICPPSIPKCVCRHTPSLQILTKRPISPTVEEIERNPRSRSAKLRVAVKIRES
ncbi:MAG: 16S rRNA (cytosine(1402)-N(4))-methyltransferase RsmH [Candidatus Poribacteria bacterium]|nr:16S rRNA (cytosine(1402)-N(4))-methyltransferase RsmH [Candidatus Poribacteria bacterium]MDE0505237.1 16S rRNA (cytosine(1402)-N(4))-methyltransferase RsmH [Candidatus Poribacteria bacterium]